MAPALVFDLDGTLVDSAPDIHAGIADLLLAEGLPALPFDTVRSFIGGGVPILITRVMGALGLADDTQRHADLCRRFIDRYEHDPGGLTKPYPGVAAALDALDRPLALCTNKPEGPTRALLAQLGWTDRFRVIVGGDTLAVRKPDPAPLHLAIERLGGGPILFVGDSEVDAETASRAEVPLLLFTQGYRNTPVDRLPHHAAFDHWTGFADLVDRLSPR